MSEVFADIKPLKPLICLRDLSNYRDNTMPESPEGKSAIPLSSSSTLSPISNMPPVTSRPLSTSSSLSGINGTHSPHGSLNGRTPSPPTLSAAGANQQLPPACGARQLSKLKRFLTTLQQFGSDISPEIGERVRSLVLGLVNSHLSIEEFHAKLQEATNFPLRPFVIPFLKANLPLLQRELVHCARLAKQTPQQYLSQNEHILFDVSHSPTDTQDLSSEFNDNGKRRSPDRPKENGLDPHLESVHPAKRPHTLSPVGPVRVSPGSHTPFNYTPGPIRLEDISMSRDVRERERLERERIERERLERERLDRERDRYFSSTYNNFSRSDHFDNLDRWEDDWKQVENMLHCILGMVDKCKRALVSLQEKSHRDREDMALWMRRHAETLDSEIKKRTEMMAPLRTPDERSLLEAKRRAVFDFPEEAVNEVKRQAVAELQKAVATAEAKASEMVAAERSKMERAVIEARKQAQEEILRTINHQEESSESCWNCGRKASETCSGCNVARYCGSFCQHKDWENHHRVCGQGLATARIHEARYERGADRERLVDRHPPATTPVQQSQATLQQITSTTGPQVPTSQAPLTQAPPTVRDVDKRKTPSPKASPAPSPPSPALSTATANSRSDSRASSPAEIKDVSR